MMILAEVEKDIAKADAEEKNAQEEYDKFKADIEESILTLKASITEMEDLISEAAIAVAEAETQKADLKTLLEEMTKLLKDITPACNFIAVHFVLRKKNRRRRRTGSRRPGGIATWRSRRRDACAPDGLSERLPAGFGEEQLLHGPVRGDVFDHLLCYDPDRDGRDREEGLH